MRILIAEDEKDLNDIITKRLSAAHYSVDSCYDGQEALDFIACAEYDTIILDIMMPKMDGYQVLESLRRDGCKTPVLFLTAKDSISDRVKGLDCGADDYLVKPFAFDELLARIRVMVRRGSNQVTNKYTVADLTVDCDAMTAFRGNVQITLSTKEFSILEYMARNAGMVLSRDRIEQHIWNYDYEGGSNVVDVYIRYLRKKIDEGYSPKLIHTVRGSGYVLRVDE